MQEGQFQQFLAGDTIAYLGFLNLAYFRTSYSFSTHKDCVVYYKSLISELKTLTESIKIDHHVFLCGERIVKIKTLIIKGINLFDKSVNVVENKGVSVGYLKLIEGTKF